MHEPMNLSYLTFYYLYLLFSSIMILAAVMVIGSRNPVNSVLYLILVFFNAAALCILEGADYIALVILIVYVGAVAILFLFVVMMIKIKYIQSYDSLFRYLPAAGLAGVTFLIEFGLAIEDTLTSEFAFVIYTHYNEIFRSYTNIDLLSLGIYKDYFFAFIIVAMILFLAMLGAITLTLHRRETEARKAAGEMMRRNVLRGIELYAADHKKYAEEYQRKLREKDPELMKKIEDARNNKKKD